MKIGSLYSGIGGLDKGLVAGLLASGEEAHIAWQCEADPYARKVLRRRFGVPIRPSSARLGPVELVDVLAAHPTIVQHTDDFVPMEVLRLAESIRPRCLVLQLPAWFGDRDAEPLERVAGMVRELGMVPCWLHLSARNVGAPHSRPVLFVLGFQPDELRHRAVPVAGIDPDAGLPTWRELFLNGLLDPRGGRLLVGGWPLPAAVGFQQLNLFPDPTPSKTPLVPMPTCGFITDATYSLPVADDFFDRDEQRLWPTPSWRDASMQASALTPGLPAAVARELQSRTDATWMHLSPEWVEVLLGLPPGWTDDALDELPEAWRGWPALPGKPPTVDEPVCRVVRPGSDRKHSSRLTLLGEATVPQCAEAVGNIIGRVLSPAAALQEAAQP